MSIDDERVLFYFRHREQIEEWAALRGEAAVALDEWMVQLAPDIEGLARDLGADVRVRASLGPEQAYPAFRLVRDAWGFDQASDPPASISLEWFRARTTLRENFMPYVGLRAFKEQPIGVMLRTSEALRQARLGRRDLTGNWWPAYAFVRPTADFPSSLDAYRDVLVEALRAAWLAYSAFVPTAPGR